MISLHIKRGVPSFARAAASSSGVSSVEDMGGSLTNFSESIKIYNPKIRTKPDYVLRGT
jgi:hypothetical protein